MSSIAKIMRELKALGEPSLSDSPKTVELLTSDSDDTEDRYLHFDRHRLDPVVKAAFAALRAEAEVQNPQLSADDAKTRQLCGGCTFTFLSNFLDEIFRQAHATYSERRIYRQNLIRDLREEQLRDDMLTSLWDEAKDERLPGEPEAPPTEGERRAFRGR